MAEYESRENIYWFRDLCEKALNSTHPKNRYECVAQVIKSIKMKKGRYSNYDRIAWMTILYVCLTGPDFYFTKSPECYSKKKAEKYECEVNEFVSRLEFEIVRNSSIYTYLDCVRDYLKKPTDNITDHYPMSGDLHEQFTKMLEKRKLKYPKLKVTSEQYKKVLDNIFNKEDGRLNHPVFFLFLPYYLFIELAKCEKLIPDGVNAFTIPELHADTLSWTIRNSPLRIFNTDDGAACIERLLDLYERIERKLCKRILKHGYPSIGENAQEAIWAYPKDPLMMQFFSVSGVKKMGAIEQQEQEPSGQEELQELEYLAEREELEELRGLGELDERDALEDEEDSRWFQITHAVPFSVPFWQYNKWAICFHRVFKVDFPEVLSDIHRLFSLSFRPVTSQAQKEMEGIKSRYQSQQIRSREQVHNLANLMDALCTIYNPVAFQVASPFENPQLVQAVNMLADFMAATNQLDYSTDDTIQERWLDLLRYGYPSVSEWAPYDLSDSLLINPSRVLVQAIFVRTIAEKWGGNVQGHETIQRYFSDAVFSGADSEFRTSMVMIQRALHRGLNSSKMILRDISTWGGVKVIEDKDAEIESPFRWMNAMRIWGFWHQDRCPIYTQISLYIQKHPACLDGIIVKLPEVHIKPVKLKLPQIDTLSMTDSMKSKKLFQRKQEIVNLVNSFLPASLQDELGPPDNLDDFQYTILLYILFSALKRRMCSQVYEQYMKLLQLP